MTRLDWLILVLIMGLLLLLGWMAHTGWPYEAPEGTLDERLERIEEQLDQLLEREPPVEKPAPKRRRQPPRRARQVPTPPEVPSEPMVPRPPSDPSPPPARLEISPGRPGWTWAEIEAQQRFREMGQGD